MPTAKLIPFVRVLAAIVVATLATAVLAADVPKQGANTDPAKRGTSPRTEGVAQAALADQIARHADRTKDVLAMIAAARLLGQVSPRETKRELRTEGGKAGAKPAAVQPRDTTVTGLLARAKQYAGGRNDLNGVIDEVAKTVAKGRQDGPARSVSRIDGGASDVYTLQFNANEPAMVAISGDGATDLDLAIEDQNGNSICASRSAVDDEICLWTPRWTGAFRVRVRNVGTAANEYRLWSN